MQFVRRLGICAFAGSALGRLRDERAGLRRRPRGRGGPVRRSECFVPWTSDTKFFKFPAKKGPFRIALANGYIANTWRIQMIQTAKAYAAQPDVAAKLKEFKVVSTGEDVPAQISAINNFIDSGYDAIVVDAQNPDGVQAGDQARQGGRRRSGRVRQHSRHRGCDQRRRRPEGPGRAVGELAHRECAERRQDPRSSRRRRHLGRHRPARRHPRDARRPGKKWDRDRGLRQMGRPDRAEGDRRRDRGAEALRRLSPRKAATPASFRR